MTANLFLILISLINLLSNWKKGVVVNIINSFIFYSILGISVFYFIFKTNPIDQLGLDWFNQNDFYNQGLNLLIVTEVIRLVVFIKIKSKKFSEGYIITRGNDLIFWVLISVIVFSILFGIRRDLNDSSQYLPAITSFYEIGFLFFLMIETYRGKKLFNKYVINILALIYICQDIYYGGRITSLQLMIVFFFTRNIFLYPLKRLILFTIPFIGFFIFIGMMRQNYFYDLESSQIVNLLILKVFVFDTAVFAFHSSVTHLYASSLIEISLLQNISQFLINVFFGSGLVDTLFDDNYMVTNNIVRDGFTNNLGGGVFFSQPYIWFGGKIGMIIYSIITFSLIKKLCESKITYITGPLLIIITATVPRWYLYSPVIFWRLILIGIIAIFFFDFIHKVMRHGK